MLHAKENIECPAEHFKLLLKLFSMLDIRIIYDETIDKEDVLEYFLIRCINCIKSIGY